MKNGELYRMPTQIEDKEIDAILDDPLEIKVYCNNDICSFHNKEMKYDITEQPSTLTVAARCVGCQSNVKIIVKI